MSLIEFWLTILLHSRWLFSGADCFAQKTLNRIEASPVNAGLYMAIKHSMSFATNLIAELLQRSFDSFPRFCAMPSEKAVRLSWNCLGQVVNLDLLLCTGFNLLYADLFRFIIYTPPSSHTR